MSHAIEFVETTIFTKQIRELATDDELKELQKELIAKPDKGVLIKIQVGYVEVRMATGNQGKKAVAFELFISLLMLKKFTWFWHIRKVKKTL